jgi:tetratricopeptide (TPR) repeat protein
MAKNKQFLRQKGQQAGYRGNPNATNPNEMEDDDTLVDIVEVKEQAQDFFEKNQTLLIGGLALLLILIGGYLAYKYAYQEPREVAGMEAMYKAEYQFKQDSFALALTNPGEGMDGFLDIIENYSGTKASNLASYYAGISYLNLGQYDAAIDYLNDYTASDDITPITKFGALGDAYAESGDLDKAKENYRKAAESDNDFLTPYYLNKLGVLNMKQGNNAEALENFKKIEADYPQAMEARDAKKYVALLSSMN